MILALNLVNKGNVFLFPLMYDLIPSPLHSFCSWCCKLHKVTTTSKPYILGRFLGENNKWCP